MMYSLTFVSYIRMAEIFESVIPEYVNGDIFKKNKARLYQLFQEDLDCGPARQQGWWVKGQTVCP